MFRLLPRRSNDVTYFTNDRALELDGMRDQGPGWWLRGEGDTSNPEHVGSVLQTTERSSIYGYDIIVAAPRPISILLALDPEHASGVIAAHRTSVQAAMSYIEDRGLVVREQRRGVMSERPAKWESVASFTHGLNRHGEPHLHDHVLVGSRPESASTVLDSRALYAHAKGADALYRASLRHEIAERTPWTAWRSFEGIEHVTGLDEGYRALWSGHHSERGQKLAWNREETKSAWRGDLRRYESLGEVLNPSLNRETLDEHQFAGALEGRHDVSRRHVVEAWSNAATFGQDATTLLRSIDDLYPTLSRGMGIHESTIGIREARASQLTRDGGARPLESRAFETWRQRSREVVRSMDDRSR